VIQISAVPLINASLRGFDVVFIAGMLNTMIWDLYTRPEIKSAEQLKGKIVGTERPGSPVAYGTLVVLRKFGLKLTGVSEHSHENLSQSRRSQMF
jgi:ABC-type nitrate/sulfonate/bicarbonate transport system substrate-binding protein